MRRTSVIAVAVAVVTALALPVLPATATSTGSISGVAFEDVDRDGVRDAGEAVRAGDTLFLMTADGASFLGHTSTDSTGRYRFDGLAAGSYLVQYDPTTWRALRETRVPTTTGSVWPEIVTSAPGSADFGWRPVSTSTTLGAPVTAHRGPSGLRVESYTDAVPARAVHDELASTGMLGAEAGSVVVRFGYGSTNVTNSSWQQVDSTYANFSSTSYSTYAAWLDDRGATLFHEYGHSWGSYFAAVVQQDPGLTAYLEARGVGGDPRVDSAYGWSRQELIAEDFRQLFGTADARLRPQANAELPPAGSVPGLDAFLADDFRTPPAETAPAEPDAAPSTPVDVVSLVVGVTRQRVTVDWQTSTATTTTVTVLNGRGEVVRSLLVAAPQPEGAHTASWDKTDDRGRKVRGGTYRVVVTVQGDGGTAERAADFQL